jgi:hypothetical protein
VLTVSRVLRANAFFELQWYRNVCGQFCEDRVRAMEACADSAPFTTVLAWQACKLITSSRVAKICKVRDSQTLFVHMKMLFHT